VRQHCVRLVPRACDEPLEVSLRLGIQRPQAVQQGRFHEVLYRWADRWRRGRRLIKSGGRYGRLWWWHSITIATATVILLGLRIVPHDGCWLLDTLVPLWVSLQSLMARAPSHGMAIL
jgi:hypothetical protein